MRKNFLYILAVVMLLSSISCTNPNNPDNQNKDVVMDMTNWKDKTNYKLLQKIWQGTSGIFQYKDAENVYQGSLILYGSVYGGDMKYTMAIEAIGWISETEGILYGRYTFNMLDFSLAGKYYAIAFKNLTENSVELSEASLADKKYTENLDEATNTFTIGSGAFASYNNYTVYNK
ncbi:hypothetical protein R4I97_11780 [Brachyspira pilosicoli]|uniref:hypothetical protein n=1 Tax=Brachyspira pilosicoli TaxID=52584 RepID=UPI0030069600